MGRNIMQIMESISPDRRKAIEDRATALTNYVLGEQVLASLPISDINKDSIRERAKEKGFSLIYYISSLVDSGLIGDIMNDSVTHKDFGIFGELET